MKKQITLLSMLLTVFTGLILAGGCSSTPHPELTPQSFHGIWKLEPEKGKPVTTLVIFWPQYFAQITGRSGKLSKPTKKIRYTMLFDEDHITVNSVLQPLDPPYELERDMTLSRHWPNSSYFTQRGHERYTKINAAQANAILKSWKIESIDPKQLEALPSGDAQ